MLVALLATAATTLLTARAARLDAQPRGAVAGAHRTSPAGAARTVAVFLGALRDGDYPRACKQLLDGSNCELRFSSGNAGVMAFRVVDTELRAGGATVTAITDGWKARFTLIERGARWRIVKIGA